MDSERNLSLEFVKGHALDAARILERQPLEDAAAFLDGTPAETGAAVIRAMDSNVAVHCLEKMDKTRAAETLEKLPLDIAALLLRRMQDAARSAALDKMSEEWREVFTMVLRFPTGSAGALMDPQVLALPSDLTVHDALERVRENPRFAEHCVYVVDRDERLLGYVALPDLLAVEPETALSSLVTESNYSIQPDAGLLEVVRNKCWRDHHALPVVDDQNKLLGVIDQPSLRRLEEAFAHRKETPPLNSAGLALGELYWIGLSGLISGAVSLMRTEESEE